MAEQLSVWATYKERLGRFIAKLMIRFKWIKEAQYTPAELNEMLATNFPQSHEIALPSGSANLVFLDAELSIPKRSKTLKIELYCSFSVSVVGQDIYRAHLLVSGTVTPYYVPEEKSVRLKNMKLSAINLVKDDYAFIGSTNDLVTLFMPQAFKYLLSSSMHMTLSLLKGFVPSELLNYLSLYSSSSKQKVLDFHQKDIERLILREVEQDEWSYQLDESDFEEQLFAELGQEIVVEEGNLVFKFYRE